MIHQPPIDKLVKITGSRYALACGVAKRARQIIEQPHTVSPANQELKAISAAANEVFQGRVKFVSD